jgi:hypothetical protein
VDTAVAQPSGGDSGHSSISSGSSDSGVYMG